LLSFFLSFFFSVLPSLLTRAHTCFVRLFVSIIPCNYLPLPLALLDSLLHGVFFIPSLHMISLTRHLYHWIFPSFFSLFFSLCLILHIHVRIHVSPQVISCHNNTNLHIPYTHPNTPKHMHIHRKQNDTPVRHVKPSPPYKHPNHRRHVNVKQITLSHHIQHSIYPAKNLLTPDPPLKSAQKPS